ncbi:hypothetical protein CKAN_00860000 [Cinnamomum micranthum f. kanehirae]|uniref:Uncharacterized protein n=1 Tax=Cinnamomum micranthum f. kanehirae TaxID=337451 RepID=A0A3S3MHG2_9MAGN|nr:hypothetical protein CKAN_00860000 [Cinnamomum micranthum f. kanehirae]
MAKFGVGNSFLSSKSESEFQFRRSSSMDSHKGHKRSRTVIPSHILAEAIPTLGQLGFRWSRPSTPGEVLYAEEYIVAKYPQYQNGIIEDMVNTGLSTPSPNDESGETNADHKSKSRSPTFFNSIFFGGRGHFTLNKIILMTSKLLDILQRRSSHPDSSFKSVPEILAQNHILKQFELTEDEYLVIFTPSYKDAMMLVGESYPFDKHSCYMTAINSRRDYIREFANLKQSVVIPVPNSWFDLRIKGSQLSSCFRTKCKHSLNRLFSYPADVVGTAYTLQWVSEARRNSWSVLLDVSGMVTGEDRLNLSLHRPDFVLCDFDDANFHPSKISCLLVRRNSFETSSPEL